MYTPSSRPGCSKLPDCYIQPALLMHKSLVMELLMPPPRTKQASLLDTASRFATDTFARNSHRHVSLPSFRRHQAADASTTLQADLVAETCRRASPASARRGRHWEALRSWPPVMASMLTSLRSTSARRSTPAAGTASTISTLAPESPVQPRQTSVTTERTQGRAPSAFCWLEQRCNFFFLSLKVCQITCAPWQNLFGVQSNQGFPKSISLVFSNAN